MPGDPGNEQSLADFVRASPLAGHDEIDFERSRSLPRIDGLLAATAEAEDPTHR